MVMTLSLIVVKMFLGPVTGKRKKTFFTSDSSLADLDIHEK